MPFEVSASSPYLWAAVVLVWFVCSWALYRDIADIPPYKRGFFTRTLPRRTTMVLGGLLTLCVSAVVIVIVGGFALAIAAICEAYDTVVWFFTKGPGTPFAKSASERFRRFTSNAPA